MFKMVAILLTCLTPGLLHAQVAPAAAVPGQAQAKTNVLASSASKIELPPDLAAVVRLAQSGVNDDVMIDYIDRSTFSGPLTADEIVYLQDLGLSSRVMDALVKRAASPEGQASETANGATNPAAASNAASQTQTSSNGSEATTAANAPTSSTTVNYFYNSLSPYGTWVDVPSYGWCWQPTAGVINPAWQPYCNNGYWLWTDDGWYWNSYYSWGWAPFHYGRWFRYPRYGWLWCPGDVWGPAWVCWRQYPGYCGWAPLPPGAIFTAGLGWTYNGVGVGFGFGFHLGPSWFTFVDYDHFCDRHPFRHYLRGRERDRLFHRSRVHNDYELRGHHRYFNRGIAPSRIEAATHKPIRQVSVRDMPRHTGGITRPDRLERNGRSLVIYRPDPKGPPPRNPFLPSVKRPGSREVHRGAAGAGIARRYGVHSPESRNPVSRLHNTRSARQPVIIRRTVPRSRQQLSRPGETPQIIRRQPGVHNGSPNPVYRQPPSTLHRGASRDFRGTHVVPVPKPTHRYSPMQNSGRSPSASRSFRGNAVHATPHFSSPRYSRPSPTIRRTTPSFHRSAPSFHVRRPTGGSRSMQFGGARPSRGANMNRGSAGHRAR